MVIIAAVLLIPGLATSPLSAQQKPAIKLQAEIDKVINGPDYKHAFWGLLVVDLDSGKKIHELNADKLLAPASVTKLYSVATALDVLGADQRFETPVYRTGEVKAGTLQGDLILRASGDLSMGGRTDPDGHIAFTNADHTYADGGSTTELTSFDPLAGLDDLARQVAASGIRRVDGDVLIDDRLFDKASGTGSGPSRLTPIMINDNLIDFVVTPQEPGKPATVKWRPETVAYQVDARVETVDKDDATRVNITMAGPGRLVVRGQMAAGHKPVVRVHEAEDAACFARTLFIEALARNGVTVTASPLIANRSERLPLRSVVACMPRVALLTSPPFAESARLILKVSHNLHASTLPLLVAVKHSKRTLEDGLRIQHDFLEKIGVDSDTISFGGGAGGATADLTTARATVQLLRAMAKRPDFAVYKAALPILGVDGTLATVVRSDSPARGKVFAKTGTLSTRNTMNQSTMLTSKALAGYMTTSHNRNLVFAMFVNRVHLSGRETPTREGRVLGKLCEIIYESE